MNKRAEEIKDITGYGKLIQALCVVTLRLGFLFVSGLLFVYGRLD